MFHPVLRLLAGVLYRTLTLVGCSMPYFALFLFH
jgi:hypothetical protein